MYKIEGEELINLCEDEISKHTGAINDLIDRNSSIETFFNWHKLVRKIEEFINVVLLSNDENHLFKLSADIFLPGNNEHITLNNYLCSTYNSSTAERFINLLLLMQAFKKSYEAHTCRRLCGESLIDYAEYLQSRRRYYITFLHVFAKPNKKNSGTDKLFLFNDVSVIIELNCIAKTSLNNHLIVNDILPNFYISMTETGGTSSKAYKHLDNMYLEPERLSALENQTDSSIDLLPINKEKIFSDNEFINSINFLLEHYKEFELINTEFNDFYMLAKRALNFLIDDYYIKIPLSNYKRLVRNLPKNYKDGLLSYSECYNVVLNSYAPFICVGRYVYSNINLIQRYLYNLKNTILYKNKRFQIRAGFIFEDTVQPILIKYGFDVKSITRIQGKEFDVITTRNDKIYNFQCKNNFIDISLARECPKKFSKSIKKLIKSYEKALVKEHEREHLITEKLGLNSITHYVISKYPIICDNPNIINFTELESAIELIN